jgi:rubrerythrin
LSKKTLENLKAAFAGESQARNKYEFFAQVAREEGYNEIAAVFEEAAENEKMHAEIIIDLLEEIGDTKENLKKAIEGESYEVREMYPEFAKIAKEEGEEAAAKYFELVIAAEEAHANKFKQLLDKLEKGEKATLEEKTWRCTVCGYTYVGPEPPLEVCPLCKRRNTFVAVD